MIVSLWDETFKLCNENFVATVYRDSNLVTFFKIKYFPLFRIAGSCCLQLLVTEQAPALRSHILSMQEKSPHVNKCISVLTFLVLLSYFFACFF